MPILKSKIALTIMRKMNHPQLDQELKIEESLPPKEVILTEIPASSSSNFAHQSSNNIMKNYCRGISNFAVSEVAVLYLKPMLEKKNLDLKKFRSFILSRKNKVNCIKQLREMLLPAKIESKEEIAMKEIFREIAIIFLKQFTPNWVYHSKIADKLVHLKYRFKILRRVQEPIYFTYLQGFLHS